MTWQAKPWSLMHPFSQSKTHCHFSPTENQKPPKLYFAIPQKTFSSAMIALGSHLSTSKMAAVPLYRLFNVTLSRFFATAGAAAQAQLDPDYSCYNEPPRRHRLGAMTDTENSVPRRGVQWAFIGSPRVKKRVYAETLSKLLEVPCISMASLARQELNPRSSLYKQIANAVNRRMLVPEDIIFGLLSKRLEDGYCKGETGFILDGIPRSQLQAEILDQLVEIDLVVNFRCTDDYLLKHQQEAAWKEKLQVYAEQSKPLQDYYQKQKKLLDFQVRSAPVENWQGLLAALHLQHINAVCFSKKRTASSSLL